MAEGKLNVPRALWGVHPDVARALLTQRTADLQAQVAAIRALAQREHEEQVRLRSELQQLARREEVLQRTVTILRDALQREDSQAAQASGLQAEDLALQDVRHASRLQDLRWGQVHQDAEGERASRALQDLIADCRRILAAHGGTVEPDRARR